MIKGVIFDLGSTLIRFEGDWSAVLEESLDELAGYLQRQGAVREAAAFAQAFREETQGYQRDRQVDRVERTTASVVRRVLARSGLEEPGDDVLREALRRMYAVSEAHWLPIPGVEDVLADLRRSGMRLGLISNASDEANAQRLIDKAGLRAWFDPILISAAVGLRKPEPDLFTRVRRAWGLAADETVMVGDTLAEDIFGAQQAGLHTVWVRGQADLEANRSSAGSIRAEAEAEDVRALPALIRGLDGAAPG